MALQFKGKAQLQTWWQRWPWTRALSWTMDYGGYGDHGVLSGSWVACHRGFGSSSHPAKAASVGAELALGFGSLTRSPGGPLDRTSWRLDGHLHDAAPFFCSPHAPSTETNRRTGCLREKIKARVK